MVRWRTRAGAGMEETAGAPSSFAALSPRRLRASSRDGGGVVNRPPSPLTMLLSRHTRRRAFLAGFGGTVGWPLMAHAEQVLPVIGYFSGRSVESEARSAAAFRKGL